MSSSLSSLLIFCQVHWIFIFPSLRFRILYVVMGTEWAKTLDVLFQEFHIRNVYDSQSQRLSTLLHSILIFKAYCQPMKLSVKYENMFFLFSCINDGQMRCEGIIINVISPLTLVVTVCSFMWHLLSWFWLKYLLILVVIGDVV